MKRLFKKLFRALWLISAPVHRPMVRKFDHHMIQLIRSIHLNHDATANIDLALSSIVRELARLQIQVEILQQQIDDLHSKVRNEAHTEHGLSVVAEIG
jgi:hypothetical protein